MEKSRSCFRNVLPTECRKTTYAAQNAVDKSYAMTQNIQIRRLARSVFRLLPYTVRYNLLYRRKSLPVPSAPSEKRRIIDSYVEHMRTSTGMTLCLMPTIAWHTSRFQRPHQIARAMAELGITTLFCEYWQDHSLTPADMKTHDSSAIQHIAPNLSLLRCPPDFLVDCLSSSPPDALIVHWPYQNEWMPHDAPSYMIYEII